MTANNVLLIMSDQHQQKVAGCYGHDFIKTPNIDKLAALTAETGARAFACDATDAQQVEATFQAVEALWGSPDLAVFNAGFRVRGCGATTAAASAAYPDKPIRLVIGSAAGSGPDITSRVMADRLYGVWNQRIVVDPRPGVAGILSAEIVNRSAPDGYTWMMLTSQLLVASNVFKDHKINLARDFSSVSLIGTVPFVLAANPTVARTIPELIDATKKSQTPLRYGSSGNGATEHLCGFLFTRMTKTAQTHVPYKGIGQALADTVAREVHWTFAALPAALPMVQSGRLRALGVSTRKRATLLPDVPAVAESYPGYEARVWYGILAPARTARPIVEKLNHELDQIIRSPDIVKRFAADGSEPAGGPPEAFAKVIAQEIAAQNDLEIKQRAVQEIIGHTPGELVSVTGEVPLKSISMPPREIVSFAASVIGAP